MKKEIKNFLTIFILLIALLIIFGLLFMIFTAKAGEILNVKVGDLIGICPSGNEALACLDYGINTIYLSDNLNEGVLRMALTHEIGHWFMKDLTEQDYQIFGEGTFHELEERAANKFDTFVWYDFILTEKEKEFFNDLIKNQELELKTL